MMNLVNATATRGHILEEAIKRDSTAKKQIADKKILKIEFCNMINALADDLN